MSNIVPFDFEGAAVRVIERDGEPWFILADVCRVLEISKHRDAAARLDDDERGSVIVDTLGGPQQTVTINESGLYSLILTSRKAAAKRFKKWVTAEVLPSIRKTGGYGTPQLDFSNPDHLIPLLHQYAEDKRRLQAQVEAAKPKTQFYDQFANAEGLYNLQNAARVLGQGPNKFIGYLKQGFVFYQGGTLVPKVQYREMGVFEVKATYVDDKARYQTYITPKGIQYFAKKLGVDRLPFEDVA